MEAALLRLATLGIITTSAPFTHTTSGVVDSLSSILERYLLVVGAAAAESAALAGRREVSLWDLQQALSEFNSTLAPVPSTDTNYNSIQSTLGA